MVIFLLQFLSSCSPDKCLIREYYYQKTLNPEYNIAKKPGAPMYGRKHYEKTKKKQNNVTGFALKEGCST